MTKVLYNMTLILALLKLIFITICHAQSEKEIKPTNLQADFIGVFNISDTIIRIYDYVYVKENQDWQRFTTMIVTNRVFSHHEIIKTNAISVHESDIYIIYWIASRELILELLKLNNQIEDHLFRYLYNNYYFPSEPNRQDIIEKWEIRKETAFMRYRFDDLKLAVFEVDCNSLNRYLNYSREIICESKIVKIGFLIDDFIKGE